jgi:tetratricopeptide (TPR) repeat protein
MRAPLPALLTLWALTAPAAGAGGVGDQELRVGVAVEVVLDPAAPHATDVGCAAAFQCVPGTTGALTVVAESAAGDVLVRHVSADGATLAESDASGGGWIAWLPVAGVAGTRLDLVVAFRGATPGPVTLEVRAGRQPVPQGAALTAERARVFDSASRAQLAQGDKAGALKTLIKSGHLAYSAGDWVPAKQAFEAALPLAEQLKDRGSQAIVQIFLGVSTLALGDAAAAEPLLEAGLAVLKGREPWQLSMMAEANLADCNRLLGHPAEAAAHLQQALELVTSHGDRGNESLLTSRLALQQQVLGDHVAARASLERAVELAEDLQAVQPGMLIAALNAYGDFHLARNELREAERLYARALTLSPSRDQTARLIGQLANVDYRLGEYAEALDGYRQARDLARDLGDAHLEAIALGSEGSVQIALGSLPEARDLLQDAIRRFDDQGDLGRRTATLIELGDVLRQLADRAGVQEVAATLRSIAAKPPGPAVEADALRGLQRLDADAGDQQAALRAGTRRQELAREAADDQALAQALNDTADLHFHANDFATARDMAQQAVDLSRTQGAPDLASLATVAQSALELHDVDAAEAALREASTLIEQAGERSLDIEQTAGLRSSQAITDWGQIAQDIIDARLQAAPRDAGARDALVESGLRDAEQWKGRALLAGIAEHRSGARSSEALALRNERAEVLADRDAQMQRIAQAVRDAAPASELAALRDTAQAQQARADELAATLRAKAPADAALDLPSSVGSGELRSSLLAGGATLIEFAEGGTHLYAYVVDAHCTRFHDLGERAAIDAQVAAYLGVISDPLRLEGPASVVAPGRKLFQMLLAPLLPDDARNGGTLVMVPTPALVPLPFEALVIDAPASPQHFADVTFVIDRFTVVYGPATPVLDQLAAQGPRRDPGRVLVLADPVYPGEAAEDAGVPRAASVTGLPRLPGTSAEALGLAHLLLDHGATGLGGGATAPEAASQPVAAGGTRGSTAAAAGTGGVPTASGSDGADPALDAAGRDGSARAGLDMPAADVARRLADLQQQRSGSLDTQTLRLRLGDDATPATLSDDPRQYAVIHCAAHGVIDATDPRRTGLALSRDRLGDGFLSVPDVLGLDLDANLVVLSACQTGRGQVRRGEGVQSLARAFMYAGARAVVASLWQVDDRETELTMQAFYRSFLLEGRSPAAALQAARLALRHAPGGEGAFRGTGRGGLLKDVEVPGSLPERGDLTGHPYFWAPFVYIGPPR